MNPTSNGKSIGHVFCSPQTLFYPWPRLEELNFLGEKNSTGPGAEVFSPLPPEYPYGLIIPQNL